MIVIVFTPHPYEDSKFPRCPRQDSWPWLWPVSSVGAKLGGEESRFLLQHPVVVHTVRERARASSAPKIDIFLSSSLPGALKRAGLDRYHHLVLECCIHSRLLSAAPKNGQLLKTHNNGHGRQTPHPLITEQFYWVTPPFLTQKPILGEGCPFLFLGRLLAWPTGPQPTHEGLVKRSPGPWTAIFLAFCVFLSYLWSSFGVFLSHRHSCGLLTVVSTSWPRSHPIDAVTKLFGFSSFSVGKLKLNFWPNRITFLLFFTQLRIYCVASSVFDLAPSRDPCRCFLFFLLSKEKRQRHWFVTWVKSVSKSHTSPQRLTISQCTKRQREKK